MGIKSRATVQLLAAALSLSAAACGTTELDDGSDASHGASQCDDERVGLAERRVRYQAASVPAGGACVAQNQRRVCGEDGEWTDWTAEDTARTAILSEAKCWVGDARATPNCGGSQPGAQEKRTRFESVAVNPGKSCESEEQTRTCGNVEWSAWSGTFAAEHCVVSGATDSVWSEVQRSLQISPVGMPLAISCHNCYAGKNNQVLKAADAEARIARAIEAGADIIEIDVADAAGVLVATHADVANPDTRPSLSGLLSAPVWSRSSALLMLEIKEQVAEPQGFARMLVSELEAQPELARAGRPIIIKAFADRLPYLKAVRDAAEKSELLGPQLRFWVLYGGRPSVNELEAAIENQVAREGFDGVDLEYRARGLPSLIDYAHSLGLGVGAWTVPGSSPADLSLAALGRRVDLITTDFDIARARRLAFGAVPWASQNGRGEPKRTPNRGPGVLLTAEARLGSLELEEGQTLPLVRTDDDRGFRLELHRDAGQGTVLRFGVHVENAFVWHEYPVAGAQDSTVTAGDTGVYTEALATDRTLSFTGAYAGDGSVYLFIDQRVAGTPRPSAKGPVEWSKASVVTGAEVPLGEGVPPLRSVRYAVSDWSP